MYEVHPSILFQKVIMDLTVAGYRYKTDLKPLLNFHGGRVLGGRGI
jgi:hypothetical protein